MDWALPKTSLLPLVPIFGRLMKSRGSMKKACHKWLSQTFIWIIKDQNLIESKSFKLYLNSFNQSKFADFNAVQQTMQRDLSECAQGDVKVRLNPVAVYDSQKIDHLQGDCIDEQRY